VDKGHGRLEVRSIRTTQILTRTQDFKGMKQGFELTRERTEKGVTTVEVVYGITSLSAQRADAKRLLELTRAHWGIENGSHHRRDVTLGEDASKIRKGSAPQVMAALRSTVITLAQEVAPTLATAVRRLANCFCKALTLLGLPSLDPHPA
jgi:predicted transposase YbfD/YdcC